MKKSKVFAPKWWVRNLKRALRNVYYLDARLNTMEVELKRISSPKLDSDFSAKQLSWFGLTGRTHVPNQPSSDFIMPGAIRQKDVLGDDFLYWTSKLQLSPKIDNKYWQYVMLLQSIFAHFGTIESSARPRKAIVFGVGKEPTVSLLAGAGWQVLASDFFDNDVAEAWENTGQLTTKKLDLLDERTCDKTVFESNVTLENLDMNKIPSEFDGQFDLVWSLCALGHIGGYEAGLTFVRNSARLLRPGGLAVHTTEMDSSLILEKFESPSLSFYQRIDLERLLRDVGSDGLDVHQHDFEVGAGFLDQELDEEPYREFAHHIRFKNSGRIVTPVSLVFSRPMS